MVHFFVNDFVRIVQIVVPSLAQRLSTQDNNLVKLITVIISGKYLCLGESRIQFGRGNGTVEKDLEGFLDLG